MEIRALKGIVVKGKNNFQALVLQDCFVAIDPPSESKLFGILIISNVLYNDSCVVEANDLLKLILCQVDEFVKGRNNRHLNCEI